MLSSWQSKAGIRSPWKGSLASITFFIISNILSGVLAWLGNGQNQILIPTALTKSKYSSCFLRGPPFLASISIPKNAVRHVSVSLGSHSMYLITYKWESWQSCYNALCLMLAIVIGWRLFTHPFILSLVEVRPRHCSDILNIRKSYINELMTS